MDKGKKCSYCSSLITSNDTVCSFCGYRQHGSNQGFRIFAIIIAVIIIMLTFWGIRQAPQDYKPSANHTYTHS